MEAYQKSVAAEAEAALSALPQRLVHVQQLLQTHFGERRPSQVFEAYKAAAQLDTNAALQPLVVVVADELEHALAVLQKISLWIQLLVPKVSDGNNFGVEVQRSVFVHLKESIAAWQKAWDGLVDYHNQRATAVEKVKDKVAKEGSVTETVTNSTGGKEGDENKTVKTTVQKESTNGAVPVQDWLAYIVAVDVKWYFNFARTLEGLRDQYALTFDVIDKNKEKVLLPRGAERGGFNMY
ncbi:TPA: hypothetical protein N0F65_004106 [Lagenidium giganteum]|uniref:Proteasome activator PA28 C-terminal domain-containing protein n=1 Tax=Lagenidium giganteum TaxID=4803 RepID=A0AAV2ZEQ0_9STRA|nr:TPA: hypothetical protein N0F65_004106 [Lagenidium giganteum]